MRPSKFKPKRKQDKKAEALSRLKNRWESEHEGKEWDAESEPVITPMLKSVGIPEIIEAIRMHDDEDARSFIEVYDSCTKTDRSFLRIEDIAFASGVGSLRLAEVAQTAMFLSGQMRTKMLLSSAMPKVMESTIKAATDEVPITAYNSETGSNEVVGKTNGDVKAMEMFHKMSGMMPLPKGAQIAIQNNFGQDEQEKQEGTTSSHQIWKTPEERLREIQDMTEPKRLPSPDSRPITIGGKIDHLQEETIEMLKE